MAYPVAEVFIIRSLYIAQAIANVLHVREIVGHHVKKTQPHKKTKGARSLTLLELL